MPLKDQDALACNGRQSTMKSAHDLLTDILAGMRGRLIHAYAAVDHFLVFDVVKNKIPELSAQIQKILVNQAKID
ncbi:MAG TPA: hypothetical protein DD477_13570 [Spirochaetaceae bacterium]|nr:hypothetical protein [Spirochaetaceae bacterium]HAW86056.1 hypothetical protein [Spirochaetaceae bacterium]HAX37048.1 hypothetical protein [Spirochaetaceae bacterium]HBO42222.1 hypothetical protein [Spirochaetaceae bacterium]HCQ86795.1 hypothetical protein [Spirochaetaceae bacterium]